MSTTTTSTEDRALTLLGQGIAPEMVASALGVTPSRISQLVSDPEFAAQVADLRFKNLSRHNERDNKYDSLEDTLLEKLEDVIPYMVQPMAILKAIATLNAAKRRGSSAPESTINQSTVVNLILPTQVLQQFSLNSANQVIKAGEQELITVQSGRMKNLLETTKGPQHVSALQSNSRPEVANLPASQESGTRS